jgi:hypothetical protein
MIAGPAQREPAAVDHDLDVLGVQVHWRGPPGCPDRDAVRAALEQGDAQAAPDDARLSVDAEIARRADRRWSMQAEVASPTGRERRTWIADDCETVTRLLVVIVGSALARAHEHAPVGTGEPVRSETPPPGVPAPAPVRTPELRRAPTATPAPRRSSRPTELALRIATGIESGGLPQVGPALTAGLAVLRPRWRADAMVAWVLPRGASLPGDTGAGARLQIIAAALRGCARLGSAAVEVPLCAGLELGAVLGLGTGIDDPHRDQVLWAAAVLGPGVRLPVHRRIALVVDTQLAIPLGRPRFELDGLGQVYRARTGGRALLGLEFRLR